MSAVNESVVLPVEDPFLAGKMPAPRKRRRREWRPKRLEQALYVAVRVQGRTQERAAEEYGVSQATVSRVLRRFDDWRKLCSPDADDPSTEVIRRAAFELELCRQRLEEVYRLSMKLAERLASEPAVTRRSGKRGDKEWSELVERDASVTASQCLKTALKASEALVRLEDSVDYDLCREVEEIRSQLEAERESLEALRRSMKERGKAESGKPKAEEAGTERSMTEALTCINVHKADEPPAGPPQYSELELEILKHTVDGVYKPPKTEEELEEEDRRERRKWANMNKWDLADDSLGRLMKRIQKRDGIPSERELYG